jgi:mono/diheme cytochrome c family protein
MTQNLPPTRHDKPPAASSVSWVFGLAGAAFLLALMVAGLSMASQSKLPEKIANQSGAEPGRITFEGEGCIECHSRMVRMGDRGMGSPADALSFDTESSESIGSSRIGPDLQNISGKYPDELLKIRLTDPSGLQPGTMMPNYANLGWGELDALMAYLQIPAKTSSRWERIRKVNDIEAVVPDSLISSLTQYIYPKTGELTPPVGDSPETNITAQGIYTSRCAPCHGIDGRGDGPVSWMNPSVRSRANIPVSAVPPSDFTSDSYRGYSPVMWYWRIAEGVPGSGMPAWKDALSENAIWYLARYLHSVQGENEGIVTGAEMPVSSYQLENLNGPGYAFPEEENKSTVSVDVWGTASAGENTSDIVGPVKGGTP